MLKKMISMTMVFMSVATMGTVANERTDDIWKNCEYSKAIEIHQDIADIQSDETEHKWYAFVNEEGHICYGCDYTDDHRNAKEYGWY